MAYSFIYKYWFGDYFDATDAILSNTCIFLKIEVWVVCTSERGKCQAAKSRGDNAVHSTNGVWRKVALQLS